MAIIFIGILVLIAGFIMKKSPESFRYSRIAQLAGAIILIAGILIKSTVMIDAGPDWRKSIIRQSSKTRCWAAGCT
jgi:hypothetical protein